MNKKIKREIILISLPLCALAITAILYAFMPQRVPIAFTLTGKVSEYADKSFAVFVLPIMSILFYLYFIIVPRIDIARESYIRFAGAYQLLRLAGGLGLAFINAAYIVCIFYPGRVEAVIAFKVIIAVGLILMGDRLPQIKRNHFIGVVNPWTLRSPYVWQATQRFTGKVMFGLGIVLLVLSFPNRSWVNAVYVSLVIGLLIVPHIYSAKIFLSNKGSKQ